MTVWARGHQRYKCQSCARTFNALTDTPLARLRKRGRWLKYADALNVSKSVRAGRHQREHLVPLAASLFECSERRQDQRLTGIVEVYECFVPASRKGERRLPRKSRQWQGSKTGLARRANADSDRSRSAWSSSGCGVVQSLARRRQRGPPPSRGQALKDAVSRSGVLLCMDGDPALIAFAKREAIEYELIIASHGEHVHEKGPAHPDRQRLCEPIQEMAGPLQRRATKYLPNYLGWRRAMEKSGASMTPKRFLLAGIG